ncbi:DUF554 domain-containing protein [Brockia lithotrophica]|uniref:DUF554 domain-containing protein n=1 Tax=Brockia lithotrophica TaxID=933949 RepID=A0A660KWH3_9BACL|nr:DUF554 domain-containing protein [Brockia lithotrophica]RKQ83899.1 hypothetical protein C7438_1559 [Brockia lithotrophica]
MSALWGTVVNTAAILVGTLFGVRVFRLSASTADAVLRSIALAVSILGIQMVLASPHFLVVVASLASGTLLGERWDLHGKLEALGRELEARLSAGRRGGVANAFVTASLVYVVGSMAIVGALDGGLRNEHHVLYTKAFLDGFTAVLFAGTLGPGVALSAVPVFLYEGTIALSARWLTRAVSEDLLLRITAEVSAVGGVLIFAIGLNLLELTRLRVANMLPALVVAGLLALFV